MLVFLLFTILFASLNSINSYVGKKLTSKLNKSSNITYGSCDALINNIQRPTVEHICVCNIAEGIQSCAYELKERRLQGEASNVANNVATNNTVHDPNNPNCNCPNCENKNGAVQQQQTASGQGKCTNPNCSCGPDCKCGANCGDGTCNCPTTPVAPTVTPVAPTIASAGSVQQLSGTQVNGSFDLVGQNGGRFVSTSSVVSVIVSMSLLF